MLVVDRTDKQEASIGTESGQTDRRSALTVRGQTDRRSISGDNECTDRQTEVMAREWTEDRQRSILTENYEHDTDVELVT